MVRSPVHSPSQPSVPRAVRVTPAGHLSSASVTSQRRPGANYAHFSERSAHLFTTTHIPLLASPPYRDFLAVKDLLHWAALLHKHAVLVLKLGFS